jgi:hypothetical protein
VKRAAPFLIVLVFFCTLPVESAVPIVLQTVANQRSENGLYSADITSTAPNEIIVGIHRHDGDVKIFSWSKKVPWNGANATITAFPWIRRYISNDGATVILHNQQFPQESWMWISRAAPEPVRFYPHDFDRFLGQSPLQRYANRYGPRPEILQFLFEAQGVHAIWFAQLDKWLTIDLKTGALKLPESNLADAISPSPSKQLKTETWLKPPSEDVVALLKSEATRRSLEAVRKHQPAAIKTMLQPLQEKLGEFIPSLKPSVQSRLLSLSESSAGYLFLARHKVPAAEKYIRKLLEMPIDQNFSGSSFGASPNSGFQFMVFSQERQLGDTAWRIWNDIEVKPNVNFAPPLHLDRNSHYLGGVRGTLRLPMVRPDTKPGVVWIYLIPAAVRAGDWPDSSDLVKLVCQLEQFGAIFRGRPRGFQFDSFDYSFATITPGEYRLKAVWDRRPPFADANSAASTAIPAPGDYESAESEPFTIAANATLAGPELFCTNRVGQADTYYAADEAWKKLNPSPKGGSLFMARGYPFGPFQYRDPPNDAHRWIVKTQAVAKNIEFRKAEVIQVLPIGAPLERDELIITFAVHDLSDLALRKLVPEIRDEHECAFEATLFVPAPRAGPGEMTVRAGVFPRKKEFTLALRSTTDNKVVSSFSIKNGGTSQNATWRARPLPLARSIAGRNIRLTELSRSSGAKFQLLDKGEAADWTPESVIYQDREGNRSFEADDFCRKDREIKIQIAHESQTREFITEFPDKR